MFWDYREDDLFSEPLLEDAEQNVEDMQTPKLHRVLCMELCPEVMQLFHVDFQSVAFEDVTIRCWKSPSVLHYVYLAGKPKASLVSTAAIEKKKS